MHAEQQQNCARIESESRDEAARLRSETAEKCRELKEDAQAYATKILKDAEKPLTSGEVQSLLNTGMVKKTGLRSARTHTRYDATLRLEFNQDGRPTLRPTFD